MKRMAFSGRLTPVISSIDSRRVRESRGVLAWMVVSEPSWPVFMAWSMSKASVPRTSPTMIRSGRMRRLLRTRSRWVTMACPLDIGRPGLQADHVLLLQLQLGRVLDGDDPLIGRDVGGEDVEQGGLAGAGAAGDHDVQAGLDTGGERTRQIVGVRVLNSSRSSIAQALGAKAPDRQDRAVDRQRRDDGVDPRAVRQAGVDHRRGFVDAPPDPGDDAVDDVHQVGVVDKAGLGLFQLAPPARYRCPCRCCRGCRSRP